MNINKIKSIKIAFACLLLFGIGTPAQSQELPAGQAVEIASSFWNIENERDGEDSSFQIKEYKRRGKTYLYLISEKEHGSLIVVNEQRLNGIIAYSDEILSDKATWESALPPRSDVRSAIRADEILVNTVSGADFVFDKDYNLRPLSEVKTYIQENRHLPEIPSAAEMQENGVSLDKMAVQLLQKVEKLTLYIIQLEQRIQEMDNRQQTNLK